MKKRTVKLSDSLDDSAALIAAANGIDIGTVIRWGLIVLRDSDRGEVPDEARGNPVGRPDLTPAKARKMARIRHSK